MDEEHSSYSAGRRRGQDGPARWPFRALLIHHGVLWNLTRASNTRRLRGQWTGVPIGAGHPPIHRAIPRVKPRDGDANAEAREGLKHAPQSQEERQKRRRKKEKNKMTRRIRRGGTNKVGQRERKE